MELNRFLKAVLAVYFSLVAASCATSVSGDLPCEGDDDCPVGTACDLEQSQCVRVTFSTNADDNADPSPSNANPGNSSSNNPLNGITRDMGNDDSGDPDMGGMDPDMAPVTCTPECEADQVCDRGTCVSACDPACEDPAVCTANGCEIPDCARVGDPCDLSETTQGEFACLEPEPDATEGICVRTCEDPFTAGDCPSGHYCWTLQNQDVCIPATCDGHSDCTDGSCVDFDNEFAICFQAGSLAEGASCDPDDSLCEEGTFCRETGPGQGVCSRMCDQWDANPSCPPGEYCTSQLTSRTALCTDNVDPGAPRDPFLTCSNPGLACDHAVRCFSVGTQDGCLKFCRPDGNDCAGVTDGNGDATVCDNYAFGGQRAVGLCWPPCNPNDPNPCGEGVCVDQLCRTPCTPGGDAAQDCCGGDPACPFTCDPDTSLCE